MARANASLFATEAWSGLYKKSWGLGSSDIAPLLLIMLHGLQLSIKPPALEAVGITIYY